MMERVGRNAVRDSEQGFEVARVDRSHVEYRAAGRVAVLEVEGVPGPGDSYFVVLYRATLRWHSGNDAGVSDEEREVILGRIVGAYTFLGVEIRLE